MKKNAIDRAIENLIAKRRAQSEAINAAILELEAQRKEKSKKERKAKTPKPAPEI